MTDNSSNMDLANYSYKKMGSNISTEICGRCGVSFDRKHLSEKCACSALFCANCINNHTPATCSALGAEFAKFERDAGALRADMDAMEEALLRR